MDQKEEKDLLEWVYLTAKKEYDAIDGILFLFDTKEWTDFEGNITLRMHELIAYQQNLLRIVRKIKKQLPERDFLQIQDDKRTAKIPTTMENRTEHLKYQIHEHKKGGIFAWEIAKELIDMEEKLGKKIENQW